MSRAHNIYYIRVKDYVAYTREAAAAYCSGLKYPITVGKAPIKLEELNYPEDF